MRSLKLIIWLIVVVVICLPLVDFALTNRQSVPLSVWPLDYSVELPVSLAILVAMALAFLIGGLLVWFGSLSQRARARRAERAVRLLEAQVEELKARLSPVPTSAAR